jgi:hypothetical protein
MLLRTLSNPLRAGCLLILCISGANASTVGTYVSTEKQIPVLELYTSHGCSSCPPADAWLRGFADNPGLWKDFIPLAFHVDYWDGLGWPDRFASGVYSERQRQYLRSDRLSGVYTPGFVLAGREWKGWFRNQDPPFSPGADVGRLSVELAEGSRAVIRFMPTTALPSDRLTAHLAIVGLGLTSHVGRGENRGRDLEEDFVVLGYRSSRQASAETEWDLAFPETVTARTTRRAIAAWVSVGADPTPLQAVGGWLP